MERGGGGNATFNSDTGVLTVHNGAHITVTSNNIVTPNTLAVDANATARINITTLNIDNGLKVPPLLIGAGANVQLNLWNTWWGLNHFMGDSHLLANSTLTITGNGTLFIELGDERTAFQMFGNAHLIINSGLIFVAETMHRASVDTVSGRLTVNGGTLLVNGLIGSDHDYSSGPITINGGAVVAQGIGFGGYMYATYRAITINGGYVRTNFIGSSHVRGDDNYMGVHAMQPITITGGVIETNHIGASWDCPYNSPLDNIPVIIEGGMINAGTNGIVATTLTQTGGLLASARLHIRDTDSFDGGERIIGGNYDFENSVADIIAETIRQAEQAEEEAKQLAAEKLALAKSSAIAEVEAYAFIVGYTDSTQAFADAINLSDTIDAVTTALVAAIDAIIEAVAPGYDTTVEGQLALAKSAAILQIEAYAALVEYEGSITPYLNAINNAGSIAFVAEELVKAVDAIIEGVDPGFDTTIEAQLAAAKSAAIAQVQAHAIYTLYGGSLSEFSDSIMSAVNMLEVAAELNGAINQINAAIDPNFDTTAAAQLFAAKSAAISQVQFYADTVGFKGSIQLHIDSINSAVSLSEVSARQTTAIDAISAANGGNGGGGNVGRGHYAPYIVVIVFLAAGLIAGVVFSIIKAGNDKIRKRNGA